MTAYVTTDELRHWIGIENTSADAVLVPIVSSAKLWVDSRCGRRFDEDSTSSARYYYPEDPYHVVIDDAVSISAVATDDGDDGTYSTTWASTDYQKCPVNGVGQNGAGGWPYTDLLAIEARTFPANARPSVKVTAVWGWDAVPADVKTATLMVGARLYALRNAPLGLSGGSLDFGPTGVRDLRDIDNILAPYKTARSSDGRFLVG